MIFLEPHRCPTCNAICKIIVTRMGRMVYQWHDADYPSSKGYRLENHDIKPEEVTYLCPEGCGKEGKD